MRDDYEDDELEDIDDDALTNLDDDDADKSTEEAGDAHQFNSMEEETEFEALDDPEVVGEMAAMGELDSMLIVNARGDVLGDQLDGEQSVDDETVDSGERRPRRDEAEMGLMSEPHSAEELEDAAIGNAIRGKRGVTRDDEPHGHAFLDRS